MITSTYPIERRGGAPARENRRRGFTLVELMAASGLSAIVLTGLLSSFVLIGKNGYNAANYSMMEAESRRALELFTEDARMANNLTWNNSYSVTLTVVAASGTTTVTYAYDSGTTGTTAKCFYRKTGTATSTDTPLILVRNVTDFAFRRYKIVNGTDFTASNDLETKQLQIALRTVRTGSTTVNATNAVLSARVVLRNKRVST
jgi:prepilin-type N-terminal cleavage/methylation domain-containing protein